MRSKPLSLHAMTFDEAVSAFLKAKPEKTIAVKNAMRIETKPVGEENVVIGPAPKKRKKC